MKVLLSPRQRWELANIFLHRGLELSGVDEQRRYNRTRLALGLTPIMKAITGDRKGLVLLASDETEAAWEIEDASADFLVEKIAKLPLNGYQAMVLGDFFDTVTTCRAGKTSPEIGDVPAGDAKSEDWSVQA